MFEHKIGICDENRSSRRETMWAILDLKRPGVGNGDGIVLMELARPAIVEQTECRVAVLLDLGQHDTGANGVDGTAGTRTMSPLATGRHCVRLAIEPSLIDPRNSCDVRCRFNPTATRASGVAERMYQASVLPFGSPIDRAKASSGWTWIDKGSLVNSSFSSKAGSGAVLSAR